MSQLFGPHSLCTAGEIYVHRVVWALIGDKFVKGRLQLKSQFELRGIQSVRQWRGLSFVQPAYSEIMLETAMSVVCQSGRNYSVLCKNCLRSVNPNPIIQSFVQCAWSLEGSVYFYYEPWLQNNSSRSSPISAVEITVASKSTARNQTISLCTWYLVK